MVLLTNRYTTNICQQILPSQANCDIVLVISERLTYVCSQCSRWNELYLELGGEKTIEPTSIIKTEFIPWLGSIGFLMPDSKYSLFHLQQSEM